VTQRAGSRGQGGGIGVLAAVGACAAVGSVWMVSGGAAGVYRALYDVAGASLGAAACCLGAIALVRPGVERPQRLPGLEVHGEPPRTEEGGGP
jgi:hypothetical protein